MSISQILSAIRADIDVIFLILIRNYRTNVNFKQCTLNKVLNGFQYFLVQYTQIALHLFRFRNQTKKFGMKKVKGLLGGLSPGPSDLGGPLAGSGDDMSDFVTFTHLSSHPGLGLIRDDSPSPPALQISR